MKEALALMLIAIILAVLVTAVMAYPFMLMWNTALVPAVTTLNTINTLQAFQMLIMAQILINMGKTSVTMKSKR